MKYVYVILVLMLAGGAQAQPCPIVQDSLSFNYNTSIGLISLPMKWIMDNLECVGDAYVTMNGIVDTNNGKLVLRLPDESDTWLDYIMLDENKIRVTDGVFLDDIVPNFGNIFYVKLRILVNLDLSTMQFIYYSNDFEINAKSFNINNP